ncbi:late embryogenesis abundant protein M17-like [Rosa chinensis]|uniref:late embryogenesis abundant protein M17-like n=1 Tax=Rosa chinensis TaxID=74649 RepID=UPI000D08BD91|nr:late embryogenesis abundant protein M17-like [Rosa chinensis]
MNFKAFILLGLLFGLVLISSIVTADQKSKYENTAVVNEATKETNPEQVDGTKQGGGGYCGRCCWLHGYYYCGNQCCWPEKKESKVVNEAAPYEANPDGYGGGSGGGGREGGWGGSDGGYGRGGGWGGGGGN